MSESKSIMSVSCYNLVPDKGATSVTSNKANQFLLMVETANVFHPRDKNRK